MHRRTTARKCGIMSRVIERQQGAAVAARTQAEGDGPPDGGVPRTGARLLLPIRRARRVVNGHTASAARFLLDSLQFAPPGQSPGTAGPLPKQRVYAIADHNGSFSVR